MKPKAQMLSNTNPAILPDCMAATLKKAEINAVSIKKEGAQILFMTIA